MAADGHRRISFLPIILFIIAVALLFFVRSRIESHKLSNAPAPAASPNEPAPLVAAAEGRESSAMVTGPSKQTVPIKEAINKGWITIARNQSRQIQLTNHTTAPIQVKNADDNGRQISLPPTSNTTLSAPEPVESAPPASAAQSTLDGLMPIIISVSLLAAGLFVVLAQRFSAADKHWAYATIGTIVGFWLKG